MSLLLHYRRCDYESSIKKLAILLWKEMGFPKDRDVEIWLKAEALVKLQV